MAQLLSNQFFFNDMCLAGSYSIFSQYVKNFVKNFDLFLVENPSGFEIFPISISGSGMSKNPGSFGSFGHFSLVNHQIAGFLMSTAAFGGNHYK